MKEAQEKEKHELIIKKEISPINRNYLSKYPLTPTQVLAPLSKAEMLANAAAVTKEMNKEAGDVLIQPIGRKTGLRFPSISTGLPTFDESVLTCGGFPRGRIIEVYGPESAGKTTFCSTCHRTGAEGGMCGSIR